MTQMILTQVCVPVYRIVVCCIDFVPPVAALQSKIAMQKEEKTLTRRTRQVNDRSIYGKLIRRSIGTQLDTVDIT